MLEGWRFADVAKVSREELIFLSGVSDLHGAVQALRHKGLRLEKHH
jgi:hypothetical protein